MTRRPRITTGHHGLTPRQLAYAHLILTGARASDAAKAAGYTRNWRLNRNPRLLAYLAAERTRLEEVMRMNRDQYALWLTGVLRHKVIVNGVASEYWDQEITRTIPSADGTPTTVKSRPVRKMEAARQMAKVMAWDKPSPRPAAPGPTTPDPLGVLLHDVRTGRYRPQPSPETSGDPPPSTPPAVARAVTASLACEAAECDSLAIRLHPASSSIIPNLTSSPSSQPPSSLESSSLASCVSNTVICTPHPPQPTHHQHHCLPPKTPFTPPNPPRAAPEPPDSSRITLQITPESPGQLSRSRPGSPLFPPIRLSTARRSANELVTS